MSVQKKSLISNRAVAKKAAIAKTSETPEAGSLKASGLTAHTMKPKLAGRFTGTSKRAMFPTK